MILLPANNFSANGSAIIPANTAGGFQATGPFSLPGINRYSCAADQASVMLPSAVGSGNVHIIINTTLAVNHIFVFPQPLDTILTFATGQGLNQIGLGRVGILFDAAPGTWAAIWQ